VAEIVKPDRRQVLDEIPPSGSDRLGERVGEPLRVPKLPGGGAEHKGVVLREPQVDARELGAVPLQDRNGAEVELNYPGLAGLGRPLGTDCPSPLALSSPAEQRTDTRAASRSTSRQRSARHSPRRSPVEAMNVNAGARSLPLPVT
jgi:hypothetical protein